jgi:sugar lactone lactonase YvrE
LGANGAGTDSVCEIRTVLYPNGTIQKFAGPWQGMSITGIAVDSRGNVYVARPSDRSILEIPAGTGQFHALASGLDGPTGLAVDASGNVYVADTYNNAVRKVAGSGGAIQLVAGNGAGGFSGDGGPAADSSLNQPTAIAFAPNGDLIIADTGNSRIRRIDLRSSVITTIAGSGTPGRGGDGGLALGASLNHPRGVAVDKAGDIFIADTDNNVIREIVASSGTIWTVAGTGSTPQGGPAYQRQMAGVLANDAMFSAPAALAFDGAGRLVILDDGDALVRRVAVSS